MKDCLLHVIIPDLCCTPASGVFKVAISLLGAMEAQFLGIEDLEGFALLMREWKKLGQGWRFNICICICHDIYRLLLPSRPLEHRHDGVGAVE